MFVYQNKLSSFSFLGVKVKGCEEHVFLMGGNAKSSWEIIAHFC